VAIHQLLDEMSEPEVLDLCERITDEVFRQTKAQECAGMERDDIVQDTVMTLYRKEADGSLDLGQPLNGYVATVVRNNIRNARRKLKLEKRKPLTDDEPGLVSRRDLPELFETLISRVRSRSKPGLLRVLDRYDAEEFDVDDQSSSVGISKDAVHQAHSRIRRIGKQVEKEEHLKVMMTCIHNPSAESFEILFQIRRNAYARLCDLSIILSQLPITIYLGLERGERNFGQLIRLGTRMFDYCLELLCEEGSSDFAGRFFYNESYWYAALHEYHEVKGNVEAKRQAFELSAYSFFVHAVCYEYVKNNYGVEDAMCIRGNNPYSLEEYLEDYKDTALTECGLGRLRELRDEACEIWCEEIWKFPIPPLLDGW
jgi:DNA-directed RNA polymerase specialized sigma24 family protein